MSDLRQGEVRWANLPAPAGRRPVLVLTRSDALQHVTNVTVAPLTRTIRGIDSEVVLSPAHGVPTVCAVSVDNIMTVRRVTLDRCIVVLPDDAMKEVFDAIRFVFAMP